MESLNVFDWIVLAIVIASSIYGLMRGFARELLALGAWVAAYFLARMFGYQLSGVMENWIDNPLVRATVAHVVLFIVTLLVSGLVINMVAKLIVITGLTATDHIFGMVFGIIRGALIVVVIVSLLSLTPISGDTWWQNSLLIPHFVVVDDWTYKFTSEISSLLNIIEPALSVVPNEG
ncbi:MAG: CvpA family protein [Gammaproteobacteria bacterium]|jgi:membrane protein required for colicin V production|nr:CvpA family protein [Gammaproteobacteria bacterium]MCP4879328.1 CvpA family protein [Gammaproteobacteria bacterium]MDP6165481.1 CvpA family protein [Gammaproteobacteria bacterium]